MSSKRFALGEQFPHEGFVQSRIERHFKKLRFACDSTQDADLVATNQSTGECWIVEAKGETTDTGLDFRTGIGQILQRMENPSWHYAIAVPDTPKFSRQMANMPVWVRQRLNLHFIVVGENGRVEIKEPPKDDCDLVRGP